MEKNFFEHIGLIIMKYTALTADAQTLDKTDNFGAAKRIKAGIVEIKGLQKEFDHNMKLYKQKIKLQRKKKNIESPRKKGSNILDNLRRKHSA